MAEALSFTCSCCGELHEGLPDYAFVAPAYYDGRPDADRQETSFLDEDLCSIDGESFFIRAVLLVPVVGTDEQFGWGVWTSLSEANFKRYIELFDEADVSGEGPYFGWLSNQLPHYPDTLSLKVDVLLQNDRQRPLLSLQPDDHPLVIDQRDGMSWERAVAIVEGLMHPERAGHHA